MINRILCCCMLFLLFLQVGCTRVVPVVKGASSYHEKGITITDKGNYFDAELDYTSGLTSKEIGAAFARGILKLVPDYEALIDSYIAESLPDYEYSFVFPRVEDIKPQLDENYVEEIEGMASVFSGGSENIRKDNKISIGELYVLNLFTDVLRGAQCSFVSVYGSRSDTHKTITGRNLDWFGGRQNQLPRIQAVITIKHAESKICSIGYLGYMGILTGFNDSKVFAGILDSIVGTAYSSQGRRSYTLDLRYALENYKTMDEIAEFMKDTKKLYTVNHIIAFSDSDRSVILENNFSGNRTDGRRVQRELRNADSKLNKGVTWGISDSVGSVNSFILDGNYDNHTTNGYNTKRWKNMKKELLSKGTEVSVQELKEIISYKRGKPDALSEASDLYNKMTLYMVLFQPDSLSLEVYFRPKSIRESPDNPVFEKIEVFK